MKPTLPCLLNHILKCHIYTFFEHLQCWRLHHLPGQPVPMSDHPFGKEIFLTSNLNLPWRNLRPFPLRSKNLSYVHWALKVLTFGHHLYFVSQVPMWGICVHKSSYLQPDHLLGTALLAMLWAWQCSWMHSRAQSLSLQCINLLKTYVIPLCAYPGCCNMYRQRI